MVALRDDAPNSKLESEFELLAAGSWLRTNVSVGTVGICVSPQSQNYESFIVSPKRKNIYLNIINFTITSALFRENMFAQFV